MDISELRNRIDAIDRELLPLFLQRMEISAAIGEIKRSQGLPVHVPQREREILAAAAEQAGTELAPYAQALYETIFSLSRQYQSHD